MRIHNFFLPALGIGQASEAAAGEEVQRRQRLARSVLLPLHIPSPELTRLLELVGKEPDLRSEVIDRVASSLTSGMYVTLEAARQTAEALLASADM